MSCEDSYDSLVHLLEERIKNTREQLRLRLINNPNPPSEKYIFGEHIRIKAYGEILINLKHDREEFIRVCKS